MAVTDNIMQLMLAEGQVRAQQARERIAQQELERQHKDRWRRWTLQALATVGPYALGFIPGVGPALGLGMGMGSQTARNTVFKGPDGGWEY
jgi:predicted anti-sigma-YlaC factor YlaD